MVKSLVIQKDRSSLEFLYMIKCLVCVVRQTTRPFNDGKNPGLVVIITIGTNSKVNLLFKGIFLVRRSQLKNALKKKIVSLQKKKRRRLLDLSGGASGTPCQISSPKSMSMTSPPPQKITHLQTYPEILNLEADEIYLLRKLRSSDARGQSNKTAHRTIYRSLWTSKALDLYNPTQHS